MFVLKMGTPACATRSDETDSTINEAMQTIFPLEEHVILEWNGIELSLGYKYDLSMMTDDIIEMVLTMERAKSGSFQVDWPSSSFPFHWSLKWNPDEVEIIARARPEPGAVELTGHEALRTRTDSFINAWKKLLGVVLSCLEASGYTSAQIEGLARLRSAISGAVTTFS